MISVFFQKEYNLENSNFIKRWLSEVALLHNYTIEKLDYILCDDDYLLDINQQFLNHDTFTDIITFDYTQEDMITGEIYISIDRVMDNALRFRESVINELHRVMVHGLLHLCGYADATDEEKQTMRVRENEMLALFHVKQ